MHMDTMTNTPMSISFNVSCKESSLGQRLSLEAERFKANQLAK